MELTVENIEAILAGMDPKAKASLVEKVKPMLRRVWLPQPGKQTLALESEAEELLYGGAAGGGKSDLIIGLALTQHERSLVFRRQSNDLDGLWERLTEVGAPIASKNDSVKKRMRTMDGRTIEGGHLETPGSEKSWQGRPHDLIAFDEGAQLDEYKVAFVIQWLRSTTPGQRQRVVIATNPPIPEMDKDGNIVDAGSGDWLTRWFGPWLDDRHPHPAREGELRWCYMKREGDRITTVWVDGPGYYDPETGERFDDVTEDMLMSGKVLKAKSRTFIRSLAKDNVYLKGTGYIERLSATPEPLKSMLLLGRFDVKGQDHPMQVIPTVWVLAAQQRWVERQHELPRLRQLVLSGDIAQGGLDTTVLAPLLETDIVDNLIVQPGEKTPTGKEVLAMLLTARQDRSLVVLDATGGWAGSTTALLEAHHDIEVEQFVASKASTEWTPDMVYKYANMRSEMWWKGRLMLDPKSGYDICLPPSPRLLAQLTTAHWRPKGKLLYIESKDEIRARLQGASTDEADAVLQALLYRDQALAARASVEVDVIDRIVHGKTRKMAERERAIPVELNDPLSEW